MRLYYLTLLLFLFPFLGYTQQINLLKYKMITCFSDTNKRVAHSYDMYFNQTESIVKAMNTQSIGRDTVRIKKVEEGKVIFYKNLNTNLLIANERAFNQKVILKDVVENIDWKIAKETKKIGEFKCQKAETDFRGRHYTAWFAPEIPISNGPWKLQGLPGFILEAADSKGYVRFQFISLTLPFSGNVIYDTVVPTGKQKIMDVDEFKKLVKSKEENFRMMIQSDPQIGDTTIKFDIKSIEIFPEK